MTVDELEQRVNDLSFLLTNHKHTGIETARLLTSNSSNYSVVTASGDFTTTSGTLVDLTNMSTTLTTTGGDVLMIVSFPAKMSAAQGLADFAIDGTATGGIKGVWTNTDYINITLLHIFTGVNAASHIFNVKVRNSNGAATVTIPMSSVANGTLLVQELK